MKRLQSAACGMLLAATLGTTGLVAPALAQSNQQSFGMRNMMPDDYGMQQQYWQRFGQYGNRNTDRNMDMDRDMDAGMGLRSSNLFTLVCSTAGSERLEVALVRLSYRLDLTDQQRSLFDDLRQTALTEQRRYVDTCQAARQAGSQTANDRTIVDRLRQQLAIQTARSQALSAVLPKLDAFYASLNDQQKQTLDPQLRRTTAQPDASSGQQPSDDAQDQSGSGTQWPDTGAQDQSGSEGEGQSPDVQQPDNDRSSQPGGGEWLDPGAQQPAPAQQPGSDGAGTQITPPANSTTAPGNGFTAPQTFLIVPGSGLIAPENSTTLR